MSDGDGTPRSATAASYLSRSRRWLDLFGESKCGCVDEGEDDGEASRGAEADAAPDSPDDNSLAWSRGASRPPSPSGGGDRVFPLRCRAPPYQPYYSPQDFSSQTWLAAIGETISMRALAGGATVVLGAVAIAHPLVLAGAATAAVGATAMWAVGLLGDVDEGYAIWPSDDFTALFWSDGDCDVGAGAAGSALPGDSCGGEGDGGGFGKRGSGDGEAVSKRPAEKEDEKRNGRRGFERRDEPLEPREPPTAFRPEPPPDPAADLRKARSAPSAPPVPPEPSTGSLLARHFPPLSELVASRVPFPGLRGDEFFRVFFDDDAPYSMRDFQAERGDADVVYGRWGAADDGGEGEMAASFKRGDGLVPVPSNCVRERTMNFNTLTKSYFGPAYAKATKTQRAIRLSDNLLVIENQTQLADIPYADRFLVVERWIVEAVDNEKPRRRDSAKRTAARDAALYASELSVYAEVVMLKSCSWEAQIQKKASETFTDMVTDWCKTATKALEATEEQKQKRLKLSGDDTSTSESTKPKIPEAPKDNQHPPPATTKGSELIACHRRNFRELDKLIAKGDLEWCSVEVMHASGAGKCSAFARVLESNPAAADLSESPTAETDVTDSTEGSRGIAVAVARSERKSRNFLRRIGSRMNKSVGGGGVKPR